MLNFNAYKSKDLQNFLSLLNQFESEGVTDVRFMRQRIENHIQSQSWATTRAAPYQSSNRPADNYTTCAICGAPAVIMPVNTTPANQVPGGATHAIQCQNRPTKDNPWLPSHCGHTSYIIKGDERG